ncbi:interaptin isoform X3 [Leptopilina boulardi]|uniref:interaptin isoform X3 n=1 Tax=Leptopilina boulardi TaxID=63433 RepID=UPI0021F50703|nr:interaptin isoform X3 [Leptopilina boulardi]
MVSAIESKDNSLDTSLNNSLELPRRASYSSPISRRRTLPKTKFSVSHNSSLENSPDKPRTSSSVPSTPRTLLSSSNNRTNDILFNSRNICDRLASNNNNNNNHLINSNSHSRTKHGDLMSLPDASMKRSASQNTGFMHANRSPKKGTCSLLSHDYLISSGNGSNTKTHEKSLKSLPKNFNSSCQLGQAYAKVKQIKDMNLSQVDELLQEMEATELELAKRISNTDSQNVQKSKLNHDQFRAGGNSRKHSTPHKRLDFDKDEKELSFYDSLLQSSPSKQISDKLLDLSVPFDETLQFIQTEKMLSEYKDWEPSAYHEFPNWKESKVPAEMTNNVVEKKSTNLETKTDNLHTQSLPVLSGNSDNGQINDSEKSRLSVQFKQNDEPFQEKCKNFISLDNLQDIENEVKNLNLNPFKIPEPPADGFDIFGRQLHGYAESNKDDTRSTTRTKSTNNVSTNTERKTQRLFTLSDFWDTNTNKSNEEMLRIKLEEEKFRREHCEFLIQELQKRLLEQQEKVAVAIRVDNEKNLVISQFQSSWMKLKDRWQTLELDYNNLQRSIKTITEKHQGEICEFQAQIKRLEGELSKTLDLASGYKEKSDCLVKEKVDILKSHADELENYKLLVQQAEKRYDQMKEDCNKLLEKNHRTEETLKNVQQELNKERLKGGEVRSEMAVIHKALDTCEAELTVLRQEKESLQLKVREEQNRNSILEQKNVSLLAMIDDVKKSEKLAKDEIKSLNQQQDKIKAELREIYQKQVDEVVKSKLQEFQTQLDTAEATFQTEFETRQRAIAECAARKIKSVIDKHQLEVKLLEEKHKEEKRLCEIQLAQAVQKSCMLESQLNTQRTSKNHLAEQLHSVMQNQWQQALRIISGGNGDSVSSLQRISAENYFEIKQPMNAEPMKLESHINKNHQFHAKHFQGLHAQEEHNDSLITLTSNEETQNKKDSKNDLRKYIKMILDMQQSRDEFTKAKFIENDVDKNFPRKHYSKKELSILSEDSITWHPTSEPSIHDESEYFPMPQKVIEKVDPVKTKPPWK